MPVINDMGISEITPIKQEHFRMIIKTHLRIARGVIHNWQQKGWRVDPSYHYFDITAGAGKDGYGNIGSPLIFLEEIQQIDVPFKAIFIEQNPENLKKLQCDCHAFREHIQLVCGNHSEILPGLFGRAKIRQFGLLYVDPNGVFDVDVLKLFSQQYCYDKIDILINCNGTAIKRERESSTCTDNRTLEDRLREINKKYWIVREPYGKAQWSFLLGTQWDAFPEFKNIHFYKLSSTKGKAFFDKVNFTTKERNQQSQYTLFAV